MLIRKHSEVKNVQWGNGTSHRFLLEADGMGYTVTDTIVKAGTKSLIEYKNHLEACYCIEGSGSVIEMDGTEHKIVVGTMYALDNRDVATALRETRVRHPNSEAAVVTSAFHGEAPVPRARVVRTLKHAGGEEAGAGDSAL